jgi:hypothetical protein
VRSNGGSVVRCVLFRLVVSRWVRCLIRCQDVIHLGMLILTGAYVFGVGLRKLLPRAKEGMFRTVSEQIKIPSFFLEMELHPICPTRA